MLRKTISCTERAGKVVDSAEKQKSAERPFHRCHTNVSLKFSEDVHVLTNLY